MQNQLDHVVHNVDNVQDDFKRVCDERDAVQAESDKFKESLSYTTLQLEELKDQLAQALAGSNAKHKAEQKQATEVANDLATLRNEFKAVKHDRDVQRAEMRALQMVSQQMATEVDSRDHKITVLEYDLNAARAEAEQLAKTGQDSAGALSKLQSTNVVDKIRGAAKFGVAVASEEAAKATSQAESQVLVQQLQTAALQQEELQKRLMEANSWHMAELNKQQTESKADLEQQLAAAQRTHEAEMKECRANATALTVQSNTPQQSTANISGAEALLQPSSSSAELAVKNKTIRALTDKVSHLQSQLKLAETKGTYEMQLQSQSPPPTTSVPAEPLDSPCGIPGSPEPMSPTLQLRRGNSEQPITAQTPTVLPPEPVTPPDSVLLPGADSEWSSLHVPADNDSAAGHEQMSQLLDDCTQIALHAHPALCSPIDNGTNNKDVFMTQVQARPSALPVTPLSPTPLSPGEAGALRRHSDLAEAQSDEMFRPRVNSVSVSRRIPTADACTQCNIMPPLQVSLACAEQYGVSPSSMPIAQLGEDIENAAPQYGVSSPTVHNLPALNELNFDRVTTPVFDAARSGSRTTTPRQMFGAAARIMTAGEPRMSALGLWDQLYDRAVAHMYHGSARKGAAKSTKIQVRTCCHVFLRLRLAE